MKMIIISNKSDPCIQPLAVVYTKPALNTWVAMFTKAKLCLPPAELTQKGFIKQVRNSNHVYLVCLTSASENLKLEFFLLTWHY